MKKPRTFEIKLLPEHVELLNFQTFDLLQAWKVSESSTDLRALARTCYLQGLMDGSNPTVAENLKLLALQEEDARGSL